MSTTEEHLHHALAQLESAGDGAAVREKARWLSDHYRSSAVASDDSPVLDSPLVAHAYAVARMPATFVAVREALSRAADHRLGPEPVTHLDIGGGTGAAAWAAAAVWPMITTTVLDQSTGALEIGRRLASAASDPSLRSVRWRQQVIDRTMRLPSADLVTVAYVLGELPTPLQEILINKLAAAGRTLVMIEPGTPAGFHRMLAARRILINSGCRIVAPCPHQDDCPMSRLDDWCHFAARARRSSVHQKIKSGTQNYEDEKFCYLVATDSPGAGATDRVIRRPRYRKGQVALSLCDSAGEVLESVVTKRNGVAYRQAREARWGDAWDLPTH